MEDAATSSGGRSIDIELGGQEVITIDLDNLDPNPEDVLDLLKEGQCRVSVWTRLAGEYWRRGYLAAAERIAQAAIESLQANGATASSPPIYALLANIQIALAQKAPKVVLGDAREDKLAGERTKEEYYKEAAQYLNSGERAAAEGGEGVGGTLAFLTRGIQQLATRSMDDALRSFEGVLAVKPTNLVALLGKARILYARRSYPQALKLFQNVLQLNPSCLPDPRIGIGLCLWAMDHKAKAKAAWQRSLEVNPSQWPAQLLLGLESINASKAENQPEAIRAQSFLAGTKFIEKAFNANQKSAAAANALCELFLRKGSYKRALKLAERTIQFADTLTLLTEGYLRAARVLHAEGSLAQATKYYTLATEGQPKHVMGAIGLAQMQMQNDEMAAAIHTLDTLIQPPNPQRSVEATVMLASLRAHPRPGVSSSDVTQEKAKARELFDRASKTLELEDTRATNGHTGRAVAHHINEDMDMHAEIARLWQDESLERTSRALKEALRISEASERVDPRLLNNLGALQHMEGNLEQARVMYEGALTKAAGLGSEVGEGMSTSILYNLARVYEDSGDTVMAKEAYDKLVARHPEYVDAKIRQAQMLANLNQSNEAHELLKQALASQNSNLNLRAFYTYFLIQSNLPKPAKDFVFATLKDHDKYDVYSLCAAGWIMYHQSRESRDSSSKGMEERKRGFQRSAEFYDKALQLDPLCAVAAQGLAIVTAEDALGTLSGSVPPSSAADEAQRRLKNARDALDVFAKIRESLSDGSVYVNMGHCYYARDEFDRAIESYETASLRFYDGHNVSVLLCLCRSWYAKANKEQSFAGMRTSLKYAEMALHIQPNDKAVMYNIAMIQQKAAELLFGINPTKRSLKDLEWAISQAGHAQRLFGSLAADQSPLVPYSREIADQRRKYGESMLRRGDEHLATQKQVEAEAQAKLDAARRKRQEEKERLQALEHERMEELRKQAEKLAEERRIAREQALEWTREVQMESDEERERKSKRAPKKVKVEGESGDEGAEPKKKRRGKLKKANDQADENGQLFSDEEADSKPAKKRGVKKRVVRDDDDQEAAGGPRKKHFKSKEILSDTDDEEMS
ncbi:TPR-like protein [Leucogyrophana mollusca]|uniref:TPR-like protein n=1 Tax=Leucogyrophana mollusca TaxID=85980 RepID=A0ACB8B5Z5_9AGAM|nr:TPR-like protein [Leucogyrophana mollusca]